MKRKFLPLFLTCALVLSSSMAFAADVNEPAEGDALTVVSETQEEAAPAEEQEAVTEEAKEASTPVVLADEGNQDTSTPVYRYVTVENAVAALKKGEAYIIDVRSTEAQKNIPELKNYANVISQPVFNAENGLPDDLAAAFKAEIESKIAKDTTKPIYILCNSGKRGAEKATQLLGELGYAIGESGNVYTITGGAGALASLQLRYELLGTNGNPVTGEEAVKAVGSKNIAILDIRAAGDYAIRHLKGVISAPVFGPEVAATDSSEIAQSFLAKVKDNSDLANKEIYVLCYSGNKGAKAATVLLTQAGYSLDKIHTVTGGAMGQDVANASIYISDTFVNDAINNNEENILVLDVRNAGLYAKGHLKGSLSLPLFNEKNELPDDLAKAFTEYVAAHKADFEHKAIYILCNSGARGAEKAVELLSAANLDGTFLRIIEGGAKSELLQANFVTDTKPATTEPAKKPANSKSPKTGDAAPIVPLTVSMFAALCAIVAISKKKIVK